MNQNKAKAEAEKIINKFYLYSAHQNSVKARREQAKYCSIIHVKGVIEQIKLMYPHVHYGSELKRWQSILTELENQ